MTVKNLLQSSLDLVGGGRCDCWCQVKKQDPFVGGVPSYRGEIYWDANHRGIFKDEQECKKECSEKSNLNPNSKFLRCDAV